MKPILEVKNITKQFTIRKEQKNYLTLRESLLDKFRFIGDSGKQEFIALNDISFDVAPGESLAIIGQNGAGKSTLLKILSKITPPSSGQITVRGRVASLLEVGTGFHSELTGMENIYLNGSILGLLKHEINSKIDEIVDFAGIEGFLNTQLKHYSSGMQLRLAFSVAAHLDPEILVIDEVLAVGDISFQKKCIGKMDEVSKSGRTILFVSHNMEAVEKLTTRGIVLAKGEMKFDGPTKNAVTEYLNLNKHAASDSIADYSNRSGNGNGRIVKLEVSSSTGKNIAKQGETIKVDVGVELTGKHKFDLSFVVEDERESPLFCTHMSDYSAPVEGEGYHEFSFELTNPPLRSGAFVCSMSLFRPDRSEFYDVVYHFPFINVEGVVEDDFPTDGRWGRLYFPIKWNK